MRLLLLIPMLLAVQGMSAQHTYIADANGNIYRLDLARNCSSTLFTSTPGTFLTDIAIHPSGRIYVCNFDSLWSIDAANPAAGRTFHIKFPSPVNGMEFGPDGMLYASGGALIRYSPATNQVISLGDFAGDILSAGDLIFYNNQLYMSSFDGKLYAININNPDQSTVYYDLGLNALFGMVIVPIRCLNDPVPKNRLFAFENTPDGSQSYMIDMETKTTFPVYCTIDRSVVGASAINPIAITGQEIKVSNIAITATNCKNTADGQLTITMSTQQEKYFYSIDNQPDKTDNTFTGLSSGHRSLRIKNQNGCYIDTVVNIPFLHDTCTDSLFVPSGFTPNGDGKNDVLRAFYSMRLNDFRMTIYNRNGQPIFNSRQISEGWDGRYKQILQPMDTYIWFIRYTKSDGKAITRKGIVTLIR